MSIDTDTPILPFIVAETVVEQLEAYLKESLPATYAPRLVERAEAIYANNEEFAKKIRGKGNSGRDTLYAFMRHWLTAFICKDSKALYRRLPTGFWRGEPPVINRQASA